MEEDTATAQLKRLELLQAIVARMASNSFLIKGWAITLCSALLALSAKDADRTYAVLVIYPACAFWALDAHYLWLERCYRTKYEEIAAKLNLSLSARPAKTGYGAALVSAVVWPLYASMLGIAGLIAARGPH